MSVGKALIDGQPVVFTASDGRVPHVVYRRGKEKEALELLEKMDIVTLACEGINWKDGVPVAP